MHDSNLAGVRQAFWIGGDAALLCRAPLGMHRGGCEHFPQARQVEHAGHAANHRARLAGLAGGAVGVTAPAWPRAGHGGQGLLGGALVGRNPSCRHCICLCVPSQMLLQTKQCFRFSASCQIILRVILSVQERVLCLLAHQAKIELHCHRWGSSDEYSQVHRDMPHRLMIS